MPKKQSTRTVYRDRKTGRFISKATWSRSHARGSRRFTRSAVPLPRRVAPAPRRKAPKLVEYHYAATYTKGRKTLNVQVFIRGPEGISKAEGLRVMAEWIETGEVPKGWKAPGLLIIGKKKYQAGPGREVLLNILEEANTKFAFGLSDRGNK